MRCGLRLLFERTDHGLRAALDGRSSYEGNRFEEEARREARAVESEERPRVS